MYFATQLTVGPVGGRYLISKMTFDKGGIWKKIKGPETNKYGRPCYYVSPSSQCLGSAVLPSAGAGFMKTSLKLIMISESIDQSH